MAASVQEKKRKEKSVPDIVKNAFKNQGDKAVIIRNLKPTSGLKKY
jgi:hypothetical protein